MTTSRRHFLKTISAGVLGSLAAGPMVLAEETPAGKVNRDFKISLAQWSLHRAFRAKKDKKDPLDFAKIAKEDFGIEAIEYVNQFFFTKAKDKKYLAQLNQNAKDNGVKQLLIMIDREGNLGDPNDKKRTQAVENHYKWVEAAKTLGCHSIRVNARSGGSFEEQQKLAADGLSRLTEYAGKYELNVLVENHGGLSSNGEWLAGVMKMVGNSRCGTLPDFGNFRVDKGKVYDRYKGVKELMPFAKAVSAKSHSFDGQGNETATDFKKMMTIVTDAGYNGYVGIEYEGGKMSEYDGIKATKKLLERVRKELTSA